MFKKRYPKTLFAISNAWLNNNVLHILELSHHKFWRSLGLKINKMIVCMRCKICELFICPHLLIHREIKIFSTRLFIKLAGALILHWWYWIIFKIGLVPTTVLLRNYQLMFLCTEGNTCTMLYFYTLRVINALTQTNNKTTIL